MLWWQAEDFAEALRVRGLISGLYHQKVAERGSMDADREDDEWFQPMLALEAALTEESCLGLHLGREQQRLGKRKRYLAAVLAAQTQHLSDDEVAREARRRSKRECRRAEEQAAKLHRADMDIEDPGVFQASASQ